MTTLLEPLIGDSYSAVSKDANHNIRYRHCRNLLRSKENTYKNKCKKYLKRKLKKYKLRHDGNEDQDIIDVSDSLIYSLYIRSPNKVKDRVELEIEELRTKNYLFRMVRKKQAILKATKTTQNYDNKIKELEENAAASTSPATDDKIQTNAFKLLMDSRNKSIGTNSPGKEKLKDEAEQPEINEKKSLKAKRNLMLQKMAEEKGSLKKKEMEEQHENYIKKKMEKRAETLKRMIIDKEPKPVTDREINVSNSEKTRSPLNSIKTEKNGKVLNKSLNTLQFVNMFNETVDNEIASKKKLITKEDEDFLKKLSPSIRKKESMLSYFKKIEKDPESNHVDDENDNGIIKVKLGASSKKKSHKNKLSLKRDTGGKSDSIEKLDIKKETDNDTNTEGPQVQNNIVDITSETNTERRKRKRDAKETTRKDDLKAHDTPDDRRPKRTVKRPVKYSEDVALISSDEELHIFTPKKKRYSESKNKSLPKATDIIIINDDPVSEPDKKLVSKEKNPKKEIKPSKNVNPTKPVKLAPIFSKTQPDLAAIEAKQKFLQSGVPEEIKKMMSKQKTCNTFKNTFPKVVHIQQLDSNLPLLPPVTLSEETHFEDFNIVSSEMDFEKMLNLEKLQRRAHIQPKRINTQDVLQNMKESYPRFPVHRIYKSLRSKMKGEYKNSNIFANLDNSIEILNCSIDMQNDNPDQLTWSDKYKPLSGDEIIGNFANIKELKNWLVTWTETKLKVNNINDADSSDYCQSESDSRDSMRSYNNLMILSGPVGCGKTSSVYAIAAELSMKVIEINASSKRTGKKMLQDLQEATQSHKVNRGTGTENSQKTQEIIKHLPETKVKKRGRPKKIIETLKATKVKPKEKIEVNGSSASQESARTAMSLILIDDADIVFDQDDGFCSAIMQLVQSSKRPVILVTGSLTLPHLQKFIQSSKILKMKPLLPNMLGMWLDLMCLADSGNCWPGLGKKFLNFFNGDMRRTINCLQFYVGSQDQVLTPDANSQTDSQNGDVKISEDDENSCMSWADRDVTDDKNVNSDTNSSPIWENFLNEHTNLKLTKCPLKLFDVWWNIPKVLEIDSHKHIQRSENAPSLDSISKVLDTISISDYLSQKRPEIEATMTSNPWHGAESDSLSEFENLDHYDQKYDTTRKLCSDLLRGSIASAQKMMGLENKYELDFPGMSVKRQRDRIVTRHYNLTSFLGQQSSLDRKALALDYWASCRAICRIEKSKTDSNSRRNNRFCHYLKSLSVLCKSECFDALANSLSPGSF